MQWFGFVTLPSKQHMKTLMIFKVVTGNQSKQKWTTREQGKKKNRQVHSPKSDCKSFFSPQSMSAVTYQFIQLMATAAPLARPARAGITFQPAQAHFQAASHSRAGLQGTRCSSLQGRKIKKKPSWALQFVRSQKCGDPLERNVFTCCLTCDLQVLCRNRKWKGIGFFQLVLKILC